MLAFIFLNSFDVIMIKKTRLFLGAYVNAPNAQNLNCRALANHLDKSKFEIHTLSLYSLAQIKIDNVHIHQCFWPHKLSLYWLFFVNILLADVVYLPKGNNLSFTSFLAFIFNKKSVCTIEGIFDDQAHANAVKISGKKYIKYYSRFKSLYSITPFMKSFNLSKHGLQTKDEILYLGTNSDLFLNSNKTYSDLQKVVMIGNDLVRKGIHDYLKVAQNFSHLEFHIVGSGNEKIDIDQLIKASKLQNVIFHGLIDQDLMVELLKDVQLHILPSRSEGFPKVILETACAAIPSIVYNDYGADQWISHNQNGYVVSSLEQVIELVDELHKNPNKLISVSNAAIELGQSFDWKNRIQKWEDVFLNS